MGKILLVTGENGRAVDNYPAISLGCPEAYPAPPFWLDLFSPSENLLWRISKALKFDRQVVRACLSRHRKPSCEDFGSYLLIQISLLEPSRKHLFIQRDIKIILSREHLITVHKSRTLWQGLFSSSTVPGFARTGTLLLTLLDSSIDRVMESFCHEERRLLPVPADHPPQQNPLWWRLRNFKAALFRDVNLLQGIAIAGDRFFEPDDKSFFDSIAAQNHLLNHVTTRLLSRMFPHVEVPSVQLHKKFS